MHVSHIALQNWKNFKQAEADLSGRMFIIGPNASGKSNLLDAFRFLRDVASEGLSTAVEKRGGVSRIRCLAARQSPAVAIRVRISANDSTPLWEYGLTFNQDAQRTPLVREEIVRDLRRDVTLEKRPNAEDESDPLRLTQTALEQIIANQEFREVADFFRSVSYQHIIPQVVRDPQGFSPRPIQDDPFGRDFLQRLWDTNQRTREAWLRRISMVLGKAVPQLK
ncbi:MAG: AAA family ATPase, partial [Bacteroidetes bacterium]|nr:AAA family ATPase [Bacteroidota bacterium]